MTYPGVHATNCWTNGRTNGLIRCWNNIKTILWADVKLWMDVYPSKSTPIATKLWQNAFQTIPIILFFRIFFGKFSDFFQIFFRIFGKNDINTILKRYYERSENFEWTSTPPNQLRSPPNFAKTRFRRSPSFYFFGFFSENFRIFSDFFSDFRKKRYWNDIKTILIRYFYLGGALPPPDPPLPYRLRRYDWLDESRTCGRRRLRKTVLERY